MTGGCRQAVGPAVQQWQVPCICCLSVSGQACGTRTSAALQSSQAAWSCAGTPEVWTLAFANFSQALLGAAPAGSQGPHGQAYRSKVLQSCPPEAASCQQGSLPMHAVAQRAARQLQQAACS